MIKTSFDFFILTPNQNLGKLKKKKVCMEIDMKIQELKNLELECVKFLFYLYSFTGSHILFVLFLFLIL